MKIAKVIGVVLGLGVAIFGSLGILVSLVAIVDPIGTKMADDGDPFGVPPSMLGSVIVCLVYLSVCGAGVFVTWLSLRKRTANDRTGQPPD